MTSSIAEKINQVHLEITNLEQKYDREAGSVQLIAVSKTRSAENLEECYAYGQQDLLKKLDICWHFIGPIQSNKTREISENFDWVHSVDRLKIARRLGEQRPSSLSDLNILLQVNIDNELSKSGIPLAAISETAQQLSEFPGVLLRGLMAIPTPGKSFQEQRATFKILRERRNQLLDQGLLNCQHLSMGMSQDFEAAIAEGSTMIRIGTKIFG
jgi:PLP dependent protein